MIELVQMWQGYPVGYRSDAFGRGVEELLIQRGIARAIDTGSCDRADSRADHPERSQKATRNILKRHKP
jgi:hypothetical protein